LQEGRSSEVLVLAGAQASRSRTSGFKLIKLFLRKRQRSKTVSLASVTRLCKKLPFGYFLL